MLYALYYIQCYAIMSNVLNYHVPKCHGIAVKTIEIQTTDKPNKQSKTNSVSSISKIVKTKVSTLATPLFKDWYFGKGQIIKHLRWKKQHERSTYKWY